MCQKKVVCFQGNSPFGWENTWYSQPARRCLVHLPETTWCSMTDCCPHFFSGVVVFPKQRLQKFVFSRQEVKAGGVPKGTNVILICSVIINTGGLCSSDNKKMTWNSSAFLSTRQRLCATCKGFSREKYQTIALFQEWVPQRRCTTLREHVIFLKEAY